MLYEMAASYQDYDITSKNGKFLSADLDINLLRDANLPVNL